MPIYDGSKGIVGGMYPANAIATVLGRLEPLITPDQLKSEFLKGIQMTLKIKDPDTNKPYKIMDEELKKYIDRAIDTAEQETGLSLFPTQVSDKLPYTKQDWEAFGYMQLPHRPISSIESMTVRLADGSDVFTFPTTWLETANLLHGQMNLLPLAFQNVEAGTGIVGGDTGGGGTAVFFNSLWGRPWVAALFNVVYTVGFKDGMMPKMVNELIGTIAAMRVLSMIAAAYAANTSVSLGIDGMSQSTSGPGPQRFTQRMTELAEDRKLYVRKLKKLCGTSFVAGSV